MIPVDELTDVECNLEFALHLDGLSRDWLRRAVFAGLFESLARPVSGAQQKSQLRQVQQYAALLPPGLRCQCHSNELVMPLAVQHWPCCPMFARLPSPADPREGPLRDPWVLSINDIEPPTP